MHKPWHSLVFGVIIFFTLAFVSFVFPEDGLNVDIKFQLHFPELARLFEKPKPKKDISKIIQAADSLDAILLYEDTLKSVPPLFPVLVFDTLIVGVDTILIALGNDERADAFMLSEKQPEKIAEQKTEPRRIEIKDTAAHFAATIEYTNPEALKNFFDALIELKKNPKSIRVLHYGDSQIEVDRISDYLRMKLQGQFGGRGSGLISLTPVAPGLANKITTEHSWERYSTFTASDKRVKHSNYGVLGSFSRYAPYKKITDTSKTMSSRITIASTKFGSSNVKAYKKLKLFYGGAQTKTWAEFYDGIALIGADSLKAGGVFNVAEYDVDKASSVHTLKFQGKDSPDLYALSLESDEGVMVDNIALRGSSGTFFSRINSQQLRQFYNYLNVRLIILQFGGNAMPSMENAGMIENYAKFVSRQISLLKKIAPQASILFIGPSDMSIKQGTDYVTYPLLETMRDNLRQVALDNGCAFFDIYSCMGGNNSMPAWVEQKLAARDYTHFSSAGARKIATLLYTALISEYYKEYYNYKQAHINP